MCRPGQASCVPSGLVGRVDGCEGQGIEAGIGWHHLRRVQRAGRIDQLDPPHHPVVWAAGSCGRDPGARLRCWLTIDG